MELNEFREQMEQVIKSKSQVEITDVETELIKYFTDFLREIEEINDFTECFFQQKGFRGKMIQIDGYTFDSVDKSFSLFISDYDYSDEIETITNTDINKLSSKMEGFIEQSISGYIEKNFEPSTQGYEVALLLKDMLKDISKFKLYIISNRIISDRVKVIDKNAINDIKVELNVWDIKRLYNIAKSDMNKESIEIDLNEFGINGLPCIQAVECTNSNYKSYLTAIPGNILADIYIKYGSRLLEGNVRSFLSVRGKVNKQIRNTILKEPEMFFAYNNGIAATATNVECENSNNVSLITNLHNLQIINGGQTTASIANAVLQEKQDVSNIMVPMKLSIVDNEKAEEIVPIISRCANSQNKVDEADFFANHPYHIKIEEFSRKVYAPAINGNQYQTIWFYERARGQHTQEQMKLTAAQRKAYLLQKPKNQIIKKVDLAKYINTYECFPHIVSKGAQANMRYFAERVSKIWDKNSAEVNKLYYQKAIALAIIFKETEILVSNQDWYKQIKAYRANIVTYSLSVVFNIIKTKMEDCEFDFMRIWNRQALYEEFKNQLIITTKEVYNFITKEDRITLNVTEWCKKDVCWDRAKKENWTISKQFIKTLISKTQAKSDQTNAYKEQKMENELNCEIEVTKLGSKYWSNMLKWGLEKKMLSPIEQSILKIASNFDKTGKIPSFTQCKTLLKAKERFELEGFM